MTLRDMQKKNEAKRAKEKEALVDSLSEDKHTINDPTSTPGTPTRTNTQQRLNFESQESKNDNNDDMKKNSNGKMKTTTRNKNQKRNPLRIGRRGLKWKKDLNNGTNYKKKRNNRKRNKKRTTRRRTQTKKNTKENKNENNKYDKEEQKDTNETTEDKYEEADNNNTLEVVKVIPGSKTVKKDNNDGDNRTKPKKPLRTRQMEIMKR